MIYNLTLEICRIKAANVPHVCLENYAPKILCGLIVARKMGFDIDPSMTSAEEIRKRVNKLIFQ